jgi:hypothetical protein
MSINNGAGALGTEIGAILTKWLGVTETNYDNLGLLAILCNVSSLYPLLFIGWLDKVGGSNGSEADDDNETEEAVVLEAGPSSTVKDS